MQYVHIFVHIYTYVHIHTHIYTHTYTFIPSQVHILLHMHTYIHTLSDTHTHTYAHMHTMHTHTQTHRHTYYHTWTIMSLRRISFRAGGSVCVHNLRDIVHHTRKAGGWSLKHLATLYLPSISRMQMGNRVGLQVLLPPQWVTSPVRLLKVPQPSKIVPISGN